MRIKSRENLAGWIAAITVPILYLFLYTPYGMDTTDFGYFYAYAWRILEGQMPYRDFAYIKPALPLYWHAFWLWLTPEKWQVLAGKAGFAVSMLGAAWFGALYLARIFNLLKLNLPLPLLATTGFVFGVHSFPHMPWHTADGVLFSAAALFAAIAGWPVCSGILAAAAALCKQSFILVPAAIALTIALWRPRKYEIAAFMAAGVISAVVVFSWIYANSAWTQFRSMTTGQLDIREALEAGVLIYLRQNWLIPIVAALPCGVWKLWHKRCPNLSFPRFLLPCYCYLAALAAWYIWEAETLKTWIGYGASWPTLFMLLGVAAVLFPKKFLLSYTHDNNMAKKPLAVSVALAAALLVAWSAAISGGYKIPAFFATPLLFSFFIAHIMCGGNVRRLAWATLATGMLMFWVGYQYPYVFPVRPLERSWLTHDAGEVYPRASGVKVDADMLARLRELKYLREKYGPDYKTLPGFSFAYYLNGDKPVYGSDWLIDWEINGEVDKMYNDLLARGLTVFMERDQMDTAQADKYERAGYGVPQRVRKHWRIVDETPHFVVFQPPEDSGAQ